MHMYKFEKLRDFFVSKYLKKEMGIKHLCNL